MTRHSLPTRTLPERPNLDQLKRQAKELRDAIVAGDAEAVAEVSAHYHAANAVTFALHDAQVVLARSYGFESWPKLKAYVDGATIRRLADAVRAGRLSQVREMLEARPELARMGIENHVVLHFAVLAHASDMVRVLMRHGADAREGIYPHRDATSALALATDRGYDDIVAIIADEEQRRREKQSGRSIAEAPRPLLHAIRSGDHSRAIAMLEANPALIQSRSPGDGWPLLHGSAWTMNEPVTTWLLDHAADPNEPANFGWTPLDAAASAVVRVNRAGHRERFTTIAELLQRYGAALTERAAVALGDADWIRARHAERGLTAPADDATPGGLLRIAVTHDRSEMLELLLDLGLDPDERVRVAGVDEVEYSWGFPLWECAATGKHAMAEILLARGADPNADVYASGSPVHQAYGQRDRKMVELLERHGGAVDAGTAALYRQTKLAAQLLSAKADSRRAAEEVLGGAACGGDPELVRGALERVDWSRDDPRWFGILEQPLRIWNHGSGHWADMALDRGTYVTCFRLVLERCDPNTRGRVQDGGRFGLTILHSVAGSREHVSPEERVAFATLLLDAGARLDVRDNVLESTPLGWACRWGRVELVRLFLERGADSVEADAEPWATPRAWAEKMHHNEVYDLLMAHLPRS